MGHPVDKQQLLSRFCFFSLQPETSLFGKLRAVQNRTTHSLWALNCWGPTHAHTQSYKMAALTKLFSLTQRMLMGLITTLSVRQLQLLLTQLEKQKKRFSKSSGEIWEQTNPFIYWWFLTNFSIFMQELNSKLIMKKIDFCLTFHPKFLHIRFQICCF